MDWNNETVSFALCSAQLQSKTIKESEHAVKLQYKVHLTSVYLTSSCLSMSTEGFPPA
jgi:hypothetical protein